MRPHAFTGGRNVRSCSVLALAIPAILAVTGSKAEQPLAPCHPNPNAMTDETRPLRNCGNKDVPGPLRGKTPTIGRLNGEAGPSDRLVASVHW